jgi:HEPN domain-containing protein
VNKDIQQWIKQSDYDFATAAAMQKSRRYLYVLFCCQQAVEKRLKGLVIKCTNEMPPRTHDLLRLTGLAKIELTEEQELFLRHLCNYYIECRYPEEMQELARQASRKLADTYLNKTKEILKWLNLLLK